MKLKIKYTLPLNTIVLVFFLAPSLIFAMVENASNAQFAEELFRKVESDRSKGLTQTEAQLSIKSLQPKIKESDNLVLNKQTIINCLDRERLYFKNFDTFYTSIPYTFLFQEIARMLFERKVGRLGELGKKSFQFIRFNFQDPTYNIHASVKEFLTVEIKANGIVDDNKIDIKTILVSTNLSILGNAGLTGESTWYFFNNPQPWGEVNRQWLETMIKSYDYSIDFVDELIAVNEYLKNEKGELGSVLFQIFVPKKLVNKIGYVSWRIGIPYDETYVRDAFALVGFKKPDINYYSYAELKEAAAAFSQKWKQKDPAALKIGNDLLKKVEDDAFNLALFLDKYMKTPEEVPNLNTHQARLLITNEGLLNPLSGIKIFREYPSVTPEKLKIVKTKLKEIMTRMDEEKIKRKGPNSVIRTKKRTSKNQKNSNTQKNLDTIKQQLDAAQKRLDELKMKVNAPVGQ